MTQPQTTRVVRNGIVVVLLLWAVLMMAVIQSPQEEEASLVGDEELKTKRSKKDGGRPHIVMVIVDDLGAYDLGFHGSGIQTPVMDDLLRQGVYLDNYYTYPVCSASRGALLSGRYMIHTGLYSAVINPDIFGLPVDEETLADVLKGAGYETHGVGKWHLGCADWKQTPTFRGFKSFFGYYGGAEDYFNHSWHGLYDLRYDEREDCGADCDRIVDERGNYSTFVFHRESNRVIHDYAASFSDMDASKNPLFLYLAFQAVHYPESVPQEYKDLYNETGWDEGRMVYAGMLTAVDDALGNIIENLKAQGMWDNTLMIVSTDNGGATATCLTNSASNFPYSGGKCSVWEGGIRGDAFLSGPALSSPHVNLLYPQRVQNLFHIVDWLPTLASVAGATPKGKPLDGVDQLTALRSNNKPAREDIHIGYAKADSVPGAHYYGPAIRYQNFKLIQGGSGGVLTADDLFPPGGALLPLPGGEKNSSYLLFDLTTDPAEVEDIAAFYPQMVNMLAAKLQKYEENRVQDLAITTNESVCGSYYPINSSLGPTVFPFCDFPGQDDSK